MSNNINKLLATGSQKFLNYDIRQPYKVDGQQISNGLSIMTSMQEYLKSGFNYPSLRTFDPQNQYDKNLVHQQAGYTVEFKLDLEANCIVPVLYFAVQYRNKNTDVTKNITHTSPMMNSKIILQINNNSHYTVSSEEIYIFNCARLSHGDKMFSNLIDNLGISSTYDIDPTTNNIPPASNSRWYFFAIPLFANLNIPYNLLTNNTNQCLIKVTLDNHKFILPSSPSTNYSDLALNDCKLIASQVYIPSNQYNDIIKNGIVDYRINSTKNSTIIALDTNPLLNDNKQSVKITARQGGCSLFLIGLRERNNPLTFASFIPINNVGIKGKDQSFVKNQTFNTDILRNINTLEHDTGEFFLVKDLVAYPFDSMIDRMIIMNYHGAVEILDDEFYIEFEVTNKANINALKSYELVVMMYQPMLLRVTGLTKDVEFKF